MNRLSNTVVALFLLAVACGAPSVGADGAPTDRSISRQNDPTAASSPSADDAGAPGTVVVGDPAVLDAGSVRSIADASTDALPTLLETSDAGIADFGVVSPTLCKDRSDHLFDCAFSPLQIDSVVDAASAPLQSVFTVVMSGDCSTQYPLALELSASGAPPVLFHLEDGSAIVRRADGGAIGTLTVTDASPWTSIAAYAETCRIAIGVQMNVPASP